MQATTGAKSREAAAPPFPPGVRFLNSIDETAEAINRSRSSVYLLIAAGELEAVKDGSRTFVTGASIVQRTANLPRAEFGKAREAA